MPPRRRPRSRPQPGSRDDETISQNDDNNNKKQSQDDENTNSNGVEVTSPASRRNQINTASSSSSSSGTTTTSQQQHHHHHQQQQRQQQQQNNHSNDPNGTTTVDHLLPSSSSMAQPTPPAAATRSAVDGRDPSPAAGLPPPAAAAAAAAAMMGQMRIQDDDDDAQDDLHEISSNTNADDSSSSSSSPFFGRGDWIKINVGGLVFTTQKSTLLYVPPTSASSSSSNANNNSQKTPQPQHLLAKLALSDFAGCPRDEKGLVFLDRDPRIFRYIINFLRGHWPMCCQHDAAIVAEEAAFFGLPELGLALGASQNFLSSSSSPSSSSSKQQQQQQLNPKSIPVRFFAGPGISSDGLVLSSTLLVAPTCQPLPRSGTHCIQYKIDKAGDCIAFGVASAKILEETGGGPHSSATKKMTDAVAAQQKKQQTKKSKNKSNTDDAEEEKHQQQEEEDGQIPNTETHASEIANRVADIPSLRRSTFIGKPISVALLHSGDVVSCFDEYGEENDSSRLQQALKEGDFVEVGVHYPEQHQQQQHHQPMMRMGPVVTFSKITHIPASVKSDSSNTKSDAGRFMTASAMMTMARDNNHLLSRASGAAAAAASASATKNDVVQLASGVTMERRLIYSTQLPSHVRADMDLHIVVVTGGNAAVSIDAASSKP